MKNLNPTLLPKDIYTFIRLYEKSRTDLIQAIVEKETSGSPAVYERNLLMQVEENIITLNKEAKIQGSKLIDKYYRAGITNTTDKLKEYGETRLSVSFSKIHKPALTELVKNLNDTLTEANYFVGRKIKDEIREAGLKAAMLKLSSGKTTEEMQRILKQNFLVNGLSGFRDSAGRTWNLDAYAAMTIRSTTREATNAGTLNQLTGLNKDLVQVSEHGSACAICQTYEGRVFSISGDDERFPPLDAMFAGDYLNIHPNCAHVLTPYIEKYEDVKLDLAFSNRPFDIPEKDSKKLEDYNRIQEEKRQLRYDKEQYERYKVLLKGNDEVLTFSRFREAKEDEETWNGMKSEYRSRLSELKSEAA